jgi:EAL domain-containing protein (putative c-di-GMP-specific phosphodiesterase class I)
MEIPRPAVLLADDDPLICQLYKRHLVNAGYDVVDVGDGDAAIAAFGSRRFDLVVSDIDMPGRSGLELLRAVRARALDVPVILITGSARLESAIEAVEHGAARYLTKPVNSGVLMDAVSRALRAGQLASARRALTALPGVALNQIGDLAGLASRFDRAVATAFLEYQAIVSWSRRSAFGYEALVRTSEPTLARPDALFDAADRLSRTAEVGRKCRALCAADGAGADSVTLFVNMHPADLLDDSVFDVDAALAAISHRVVIEITERARLETVPDASRRVQQLRNAGFRIAIDDLGAGYAGLTSFAVLDPQFVKLDRALIVDIDQSRTKRALVGAMIDACRSLGVEVIAEGIETEAERDVVVSLGCDLLQGYLFARPAGPWLAPSF